MSRAFTLIELIATIVLLGILSAVAFPRFVDFSGDARLARIETAAAGLQTAITMSQNKWRAQGSSGSTVLVGSVLLNVNSLGCPTPIPNLSVANKNTMTNQDVADFWDDLMESPLPSGFTPSSSAANNWYQYEDPKTTDGTCKFRVSYADGGGLDDDSLECIVTTVTSGC